MFVVTVNHLLDMVMVVDVAVVADVLPVADLAADGGNGAAVWRDSLSLDPVSCRQPRCVDDGTFVLPTLSVLVPVSASHGVVMPLTA